MISEDRLYQDSWANIRATDDISFKLIGLVPLISGASILTFFLKAESINANPGLVIGLSLFASLITLAVFRWELRNMQTCRWHLKRVKQLELELQDKLNLEIQSRPPQNIGKSEAAKFIYSITILSWLLMPAMLLRLPNLGFSKFMYLIFSVIIVVLTIISINVDINSTTSDKDRSNPLNPFR